MPTALTILLLAILTFPQAVKPRARDLGVPFEGTPGTLNTITDVAGVEVGFTTLVDGDGPLPLPRPRPSPGVGLDSPTRARGGGPLQVGKGPVRTGVTAVLPRGKAST